MEFLGGGETPVSRVKNTVAFVTRTQE